MYTFHKCYVYETLLRRKGLVIVSFRFVGSKVESVRPVWGLWWEISWSRLGFLLHRILFYSDGTYICFFEFWQVCAKQHACIQLFSTWCCDSRQRTLNIMVKFRSCKFCLNYCTFEYSFASPQFTVSQSILFCMCLHDVVCNNRCKISKGWTVFLKY